MTKFLPVLCLVLALTAAACAPSPKTAGNFSMTLNNYEQAVTEYQKALKYDPDSVILLTGLGRAYYQLANFDEAENAFNGALQIQPDYPQASFYLGLCAIAKGDRANGFAILRDFRYLGKPEVTDSVRTMADLLASNTEAPIDYIEKKMFEAWDDGLIAEKRANDLH